jgi:hypothetical protein
MKFTVNFFEILRQLWGGGGGGGGGKATQRTLAQNTNLFRKSSLFFT